MASSSKLKGKVLEDRFCQKFRKGVGWREEILPTSEIEATFLQPFPYASLA